MTEWPWAYLFTAAQTELGKSEEWFWETEPRILIAMLEEKRRIDKAAARAGGLMVALWMNGHDPDEELQSDDTASGTPGIDYPAGDGVVAHVLGG